MIDKENSEKLEKAQKEDGPHTKQQEEQEQEIGGPKHGEPTIFGDWAVKGRVSDF